MKKILLMATAALLTAACGNNEKKADDPLADSGRTQRTTAALLTAACGNNEKKADDPLADSGRTQRTENLLENLKAIGDSTVYLFGHHDDTVYGIGWEADYSNDSTIHQRSESATTTPPC